MIDRFLQLPLDLCGAGAASLSLPEASADGELQFRWTSLAGKLSSYLGGTAPRKFGPCGVTFELKSPQLFAYPGSYFQHINQVDVPIVEGLVIPFHMGPKAEGTTWIVSHDEDSKVDSKGARIMGSLAGFVGWTLHVAGLPAANSHSAGNRAPSPSPSGQT